ncbi:hypothetical protein [Brevibacterium luteolum]|uniref:Uncharacterized protein n=2 Tax=Brevibacterium luteolum TaxID=199591 RepID=A0A849AN74_9MICO|nr:hypothetical protein [Brevibacterium luteolum]MBM7530679.1 hypothetical protein [Brevibacterium luteolum]NNG78067.1 hypothetical protein [Brevibacterium luteolum]
MPHRTVDLHVERRKRRGRTGLATARALAAGTRLDIDTRLLDARLGGMELANRMPAAGEAHTLTQGVEALLIGDAAQRLLSGPLSKRCDFRQSAHVLLRQ